MIEYSDEDERRQALATLIGIEKKVWMQVEGCGKVYPIANEDLDRETEDKTAAVHFLRFELTPQMIAAAKAGAAIRAGIDHDRYRESLTVPAAVRESLVADLG
jgi:hypothetical protein